MACEILHNSVVRYLSTWTSDDLIKLFMALVENGGRNKVEQTVRAVSDKLEKMSIDP